MRVIIILTLLLTSPLCLKAQSSDPEQKEFVQFIMTNLPSKEKAMEIDDHFRSKQGVFMARADINSKKFLVIYYTNSGITEEQTLIWMDEMGITYKCVRHGIHGVDVIKDQKMDCE